MLQLNMRTAKWIFPTENKNKNENVVFGLFCHQINLEVLNSPLSNAVYTIRTLIVKGTNTERYPHHSVGAPVE